MSMRVRHVILLQAILRFLEVARLIVIVSVDYDGGYVGTCVELLLRLV